MTIDTKTLVLKKSANPRNGALEAYGVGIPTGSSYIGSIMKKTEGWYYSAVDPAEKLPLTRHPENRTFAVSGFFPTKEEALENLAKAHELAGG